MRLERLTRGHVVAAVAALALLLVMAMDWYGSQEADLAHRIASGSQNSGTQAGEAARQLKQDAEAVIARDEKNAWQEERTIDRVLLVLLLLSVFLPLFVAAYRAAGRRSRAPAALAALTAAATALLLAYRIVNEPGNDAVTTIKIGAPIGLALLVIVGIASAAAFQSDADWVEPQREPSAPDEVPAPDQPDAPATS